MIRFGNCMTDIAVTLQDYEMAEALGIENGNREMRTAYNTIDWDKIDAILSEIAIALVAKNGAKVRQALSTEDKTEVPEDGDASENEPTHASSHEAQVPDISDFDGIWCRFGDADNPSSIECFDVDIEPVLDGIHITSLPAWAEDFHTKKYGNGQGLWAAALIHGILDDQHHYYFDAIDETTYEHYYDERLRREGRRPVHRDND